MVTQAPFTRRPGGPPPPPAVLGKQKGRTPTPGAGAPPPPPTEPRSPAYYVKSFRHVYEGGRALLKVTLGPAWANLARHRFPRAVEFAAAAKNIFGQLQHIAAPVGYELSSSGASSASAN